MLLREATSETYGPRVISFAIYLAFILLCIFYHKNTKNIILSYLSDLTLVSGLIGIDNPYLRWLRGFILFCAGMRDSRVASYWIDTLVLKN